MTTDSNLDQTLSMLDQQVVPDGHEAVEEARSLATRLGLPFDPLDEFHMERNCFVRFLSRSCCDTSSSRCEPTARCCRW